MKRSLKIFFSSFFIIVGCQNQDVNYGHSINQDLLTKKNGTSKMELLPGLESYLTDVEENFQIINSVRIDELKLLAKTISQH